MAYAELAGLPAITGLYTTVVCLVAYALVGPSPVLVLGPDSSLGPMIAATILPLAAGNQEQAIALAGMLAILVGLITVGAGAGQARLRRRPALEPGPDRLPGRPGRRDLRRPAAQAVRVQHRRERPGRRGGGIRPGPRPDQPVGARHRPAQPRHHPGPHAGVAADARHPRRRRRRDRAVDRARPRGARRGRDRRAPAGLPVAVAPARAVSDIPLLFAAAVGISLVAIGDTISTSGGFAGARATRSTATRSSPGSARPTSPQGFFSGFPVSTSGSRTAVASQSGAKTQLTGLVAAASCCDAPRRARPRPGDAAARARGRRHRRVDQPVRRRPSFAGCTASASRSSRWPSRAASAWLSSASSRASSSPSSCRSCTSSSAPGRRTRRSWASRRRPRLPRHPALSGREAGAGPDHRSLVGTAVLRQREPVPRPDPRAGEAADPPPQWVLVAAEPITDIDTTAGEMLADLDLELNAAGIHLAFAELLSAVRDASSATGSGDHRGGPLLRFRPQCRQGVARGDGHSRVNARSAMTSGLSGRCRAPGQVARASARVQLQREQARIGQRSSWWRPIFQSSR